MTVRDMGEYLKLTVSPYRTTTCPCRFGAQVCQGRVGLNMLISEWDLMDLDHNRGEKSCTLTDS